MGVVAKEDRSCDSVTSQVVKLDAVAIPEVELSDDVTDLGHTLRAHSYSEVVDPVSLGDRSLVTSPAAMFPVIDSELFVAQATTEFTSVCQGECLSNVAPVYLTPVCADIGQVPIYQNCILGTCDCLFTIGSSATQLKPCRAAQFLFGPTALDSIPDTERDFLWAGLNNGFAIVDADCPSTYYCENYDSILEDATHNEMTNILEREIDEGKVSVVSDIPLCVHSLGAVRKANGSLRPITDCSRPEGSSINNYMSSTFQTFTYNSVQDAVDVLVPGDHMAVVDISSAYRAVSIRADHATFQGLTWDFGAGKVCLQDNRLCFGLKCAPNIFDSLSRFIVAISHARGAPRVINYLDDFLVLGASADLCLAARDIVTSTITLLGFQVSWKKVSDPNPVTTFLGITIDSLEMELSLPMEKVTKLKNLISTVLDRGRTSKRELECLGGLVSYCSYVVRGGRTFSRRIFDLAASYSRASKSVPLNDAIRADLKWWLAFCSAFNGRACIIRDTHSLHMYSDSSFRGFGAWLGKDYVYGFWDTAESLPDFPQGCSHMADPPHDLPAKPNINVYELWPLVVGLKRWGSFFRNSRLRFITDNMQVLAMVNTGRSSNTTCMSWLREMFWLCFLLNIDIWATYIPSADNVLADALSRVLYPGVASKCLSLLDTNNMCCSSPSRSTHGCTSVSPATPSRFIPCGLNQEVSPLTTTML